MATPENRFCTQAEYDAGLETRIYENNVRVDGLYSLVMQLKPIQPYAGVIYPVIVEGIEPLNEHRRRPLHLRFPRENAAKDIQARPEMREGLLYAFGNHVVFTSPDTAIQRVDAGYLRERLDGDQVDAELRAMISQATDLSTANTHWDELQLIR